jgi:acylphosphatase
MAMIAKRIIYSGRVQGVGFRYTTRHIAQGYAVAGYVRNLPDGSVEVVVEGAPDQVEAFIAAVEARMGDYVQHTAAHNEAPGNHRGFRIER